MSETAIRAAVIVGVDTHKHVHAAVAIDALGTRLGDIAVPVSAKGYRDLEAWARSFGIVRAFGVEGTGSYGAGLSRFLRERGHVVLEVDRPSRQLRHRKGKSDPLDAEAAARAVLGGQAAGLPKGRFPEPYSSSGSRHPAPLALVSRALGTGRRAWRRGRRSWWQRSSTGSRAGHTGQGGRP